MTAIEQPPVSTATYEVETVTAFQQFFPPNPVKHGRFLGIDGKTKKKRVETCDGQPVTPEMIQRHLGAPGKLNNWGLGYLPGGEDATPCGLIDLDDKDFPGEQMDAARQAVLDACSALGLNAYLERSSRGVGWHIWLFSDEALPYPVMGRALRTVLKRASLKAEVYPKGDNPASSWVITPYHRALRDDRRLGKTWLELDDGQPIPVDELGEYITPNPAETLRALGVVTQTQDTAKALARPAAPMPDEPGDLAPDAVPLLLKVAQQKAPDGGRHDALAAFLNLGQRAGDLAGMVAGLKADAVFGMWCADGSRTPDDWADEIDRWAANVQADEVGQRRGLTYLREEAGYSVPRLPKRVSAGLPEIVVNERHLREIAADAEAALLAANMPPTLFQRGGELVRLASDEGGARLKALDAVALKGKLARVADFVALIERTEKGEDGKREVVTDSKPARPPADLAPDLLARTEHLGLPPLRTLAQSPVYAPVGELVSAEGYHEGSGIYLALRGLTVPPLPSVPDALALLRELLTDFPFSPHESGFAHTLAALLLPFVRPMIDGPTPLHLIEAPTRGSGKGLLSDVIAYVTVGGAAGVMVQPKDGDEFEKRVTSILLEGTRLILLDNVHTLKGEALAAALTSAVWRGRRLGKSEMLTLPNEALWLSTGNNVTLDDDMPRRIIPIRLDPGVERPEERSGFKHPDLLAWIKANRPALVAACLSLVEAWKAAGRPRGTARLGSFESWAATIGGILEVAGVPGFLTGRAELYETANAEPQEWAALLEALHRHHGSESIGARDVLTAMKALDVCSDYWEGKQQGSAVRRVGRAVSQRRDRVFGGYRIRLAGKTATGNAGYRIEPSGGDQKKTPETPKTPDEGQETLSGTVNPENVSGQETPGVSAVFVENTGETPEKHRAREAVSDDAEGVSGVFGVFSGHQPEREDAVEL